MCKVRKMRRKKETERDCWLHHLAVFYTLSIYMMGWQVLVTMAAIAAETEPPPGAGVRAPTLWTNWRKERDASGPSV